VYLQQGVSAMPYHNFQAQCETFLKLLNELPKTENEHINTLTKRYVEQNLAILNEIMQISIDHLKQIKIAESAKELVNVQVNLTNEISKKLLLSAQRFIDASLDANIAYHNDLLKACDLATD
jgi:hypothetical protein